MLIVGLSALVGAIASCPYFVLPLTVVGVTSALILRPCLALQDKLSLRMVCVCGVIGDDDVGVDVGRRLAVLGMK